MKARCPNCNAIYNIDESKIPEKGAHATCAKCKTRFQIKKEQGQPEQKENQTVQGNKEVQIIITCPQCGHVNISSDKCAQCGNVFSEADREKLAIQI